MVSKEEQTTKPQRKEKIEEDRQPEVSSAQGDEASMEEDAVDERQKFDPETAEREVLLAKYR